MSIVREEEGEDGTFKTKHAKKTDADDELFDSIVKEAADRDDLGEDDDDTTDVSQADNRLKDFTFMGGKAAANQDEMSSKMDSIEAIRDYLEAELGEKALLAATPILYDFGDDILFEERTADLCQRLSHLMTKDQVAKYQNFFCLLVFYNKQL